MSAMQPKRPTSRAVNDGGLGSVASEGNGSISAMRR